jgi:hypothetical protein
MSARKRWMGLTPLGAALVALVSRPWHRDDPAGQEHMQAESVDTTK